MRGDAAPHEIRSIYQHNLTMKIYCSLLAAACALLSAPVLSAEDQLIGGTVESLLDYARERHPEFAAMRLEAQAAGERIEPAGALPDPLLRAELVDVTNAGSDASPNLLPARVGGTKYTLIQPLPWFGKRALKRDVAAAGAAEAHSRTRATWMELATRIKLNTPSTMHGASLTVARENLDLLERLERIARLRYANGLAAQQDVIRAQAEQTMLRSDLALLEGESAQSSARIRSLLGRPPINVKLRPPEKLRPPLAPEKLDFVALEARLLDNNPQLAAEHARVASADKSRELVYKNRYPDFSVGISPIQTRNRVSEWELMFEINIPLQQDSRRAQERESELMLDAARLRREATLNQSLADLSESLAGMEAARRVENLAGATLLPQAQLTLQAALAGYETGKVDFATVLEAQRQIRKARLDIVKARGDQQMRRAEIERLIGEEL